MHGFERIENALSIIHGEKRERRLGDDFDIGKARVIRMRNGPFAGLVIEILRTIFLGRIPVLSDEKVQDYRWGSSGDYIISIVSIRGHRLRTAID